jgi:hypothetical protein
MELEFDDTLHRYLLNALTLFDIMPDYLAADVTRRANVIRGRPEPAGFPNLTLNLLTQLLVQTEVMPLNSFARPAGLYLGGADTNRYT